MLEFITEFFEDADWNVLGIALALWAFCLLVLWKFMYDTTFIKPVLKIIMSILMLPISYTICYLMTR